MQQLVAVGRKLLSLVLLLAAATFLAHLTLSVAQPSNSWDGLLRGYLIYVGSVARGDFGQTVRGEQVVALLARTFVMSFGVLALAVLLATVAGVGIGLLGYSGRGSDRLFWPVAFSVLLLSAPSFLVGGLFQYLDVEITARTGTIWLPTTGFGWDQHLVMPVLVLAAKPAAYLARVVSQTLDEALRENYVRTAHAKGLRLQVVLLRHGLRTQASSVLAGLALATRLSVGMLPVVEMVFVYPGMGFAFLYAIRGHDVQAAAGLAIALAATLWLLNEAIGLARRALDPRLRTAR